MNLDELVYIGARDKKGIMSVDKLKRVLWRIKEWKLSDDFHERDLRRAIMLECGTDRMTVSLNRKAMLELKMIKRWQCKRYRIIDDNPC